MSPFLYPGKGEPLIPATSISDNSPDYSSTTEIDGKDFPLVEAGGYSQRIGIGETKEAMFLIEFDAAATGDVIIQRYNSGQDAYDTIDTQAVAAEYTAQWSAGEALMGEYRVFNDTDVDAVIYVQKRIV